VLSLNVAVITILKCNNDLLAVSFILLARILNLFDPRSPIEDSGLDTLLVPAPKQQNRPVTVTLPCHPSQQSLALLWGMG
jgi:hypothetical protein